jgi:uncharacterized protein (TIGR00297 family)
VGGFVAATPYLFAGPVPIHLLAICFVVGNAVARYRQWWPSIHTGRPESVGTVTFPLAVVPALAIAWPITGGGHPWVITAAFLVLGVADPAAAWAGERFGRARCVGSAQKSWVGSIAFAAAAWTISFVTVVATGAGSVVEAAGISLVLAVTTAMTEALGGKGWDNFFIVVTGAVVLVAWADGMVGWPALLAATGAGLVFAVATWQAQWLSPSGSLAGGLLAASLIALGGAAWAVPAIVFFVLSSLWSRVGSSQKDRAVARSEKGTVRDAGQVYANGAVGWGLLITYAVVWEAAPLYWGFLGAFAAAAADTWATELGTMAHGRPLLLTTGRRVPAGTSGAVSGWGTLASAAGAATVALSAWVVAVPAFAHLGPFTGLALVTGAGVSGALVDSLLGATVQAQYAGPTGGWSEQPSGSLVRGVQWMTNDRVNILGTLFGAVAAGLGAGLLGA